MTETTHYNKEAGNNPTLLRDWFTDAPGQEVSEVEFELAKRVLPNLFGYHIVQIGNHYERKLIETSRISHQVVVGLDGPDRTGQLVCRDYQLPLAANSVDVVVLPHILEFSVSPHDVLRESERILIGEGRLLVIGFNPWSMFGLWRTLLGWRGTPPWSGKFLGVARVKDWLSLLGFEIELSLKASFRPPLRRAGVYRRIEFLERLGAHFWPIFGNVYLLLAKKKVVAGMPLRVTWNRRPRIVAGSVVEPTTRMQ